MSNRRRLSGSVQSLLPDGYTQFDYIRSNGSSYLDTGLKMYPVDFSMKIKFDFTELNIYSYLFGIRVSNSNTKVVHAQIANQNLNWSYLSSGYTVNNLGSLSANTVYVFEMNLGSSSKEAYVEDTNGNPLGGVRITNTSWTGVSYSNIPLFYHLGQNGVSISDKVRIYEVEINHNDVVYTFIPCINSNNVSGMYELARELFISGTNGNLITGNI